MYGNFPSPPYQSENQYIESYGIRNTAEQIRLTEEVTDNIEYLDV
jgi:hypothetical protein